MKLAVTIDVEEEGLFSGQYPSGDAPVANVRHLERLGGLMSDFGIRPTLFVTWQVARHQALMAHLLNWRDAWQGEIGAHLHHWNTPPLEEPTGPARKGPIDSEGLPQQLLRDRLNTLLDTLRAAGAPGEAFRMGRFNLGPRMWAVLHETDIRVDASIAPMRAFPGGPDHMAAPWDPYYPDVEDPTRPGRAHILEVPLTIVPLLPWPRPMANHPAAARLIQWAGSLPAQPMWVGLRRLKAAAWLHRLRGGRVLTVFFHSSELIPGGSPKHPTEAHVSAFLERLRGFFSFVVRDLNAEPVTVSGLRRMFQNDRGREGDGEAVRP